ncbi:aminotransferase class I/II-fold pyridoxal phosphate-dependent enzyme [Actinoplanes derwentensis]|uniref:DNA-binding transcriptional regulator, MocR family, contains an aminotransferase domain n=1 Tax=Actinoplanes derwentensis TaxID=113562 RepID=A0A1H2D636_9ACTN|nr:aminotransferase class I/II-fold pyridoxal phosphate-dependent enzyme [Actinoplanes derwentensis]GID85326.1 GntR family transcriptional regulator [Actinoplanes derwentensis]SDT77922.1 DNA-binding transcriptional regulator, MocR family, contains an aminotransferase domain [Actinoplanes derwentensis]
MAEQYQVSGESAAEISASIESGVVRGDWIAGAALPSVRVLAGALHVSPATVAKAYQELRQRGVIETEGRRGTRVRARPAVAVSRAGSLVPAPPGLRDLSTGEPDLRLLPSLAPALTAAGAADDPPRGYVSAVTMPELVDAARVRLTAEGIPVGDADLVVTSGALDSIERVLVAHLRSGDAVAVEDPGWAGVIDLLAALGLRVLPVAVDRHGPDPGAMENALRAGARAVIVTVRAQNPTGATVSAERAGQLRTLLSAHPGVVVIEDDHAAELAEREAHCIGPVTGSWAFIRSASKPFGPDLRIAVLAGDETTVARVAGRMRIGMGWVSTVLQRLLLWLWQDPEVTGQVAGAARAYGERRRELRAALWAEGVEAHGDTGINVWIPVPDETRAITVLRDRGYAVAPGAIFRIDSPPGIRVTISTLEGGEAADLAGAVAAAIHPAGAAHPMR